MVPRRTRRCRVRNRITTGSSRAAGRSPPPFSVVYHLGCPMPPLAERRFGCRTVALVALTSFVTACAAPATRPAPPAARAPLPPAAPAPAAPPPPPAPTPSVGPREVQVPPAPRVETPPPTMPPQPPTAP